MHQQKGLTMTLWPWACNDFCINCTLIPPVCSSVGVTWHWPGVACWPSHSLFCSKSDLWHRSWLGHMDEQCSLKRNLGEYRHTHRFNLLSKTSDLHCLWSLCLFATVCHCWAGKRVGTLHLFREEGGESVWCSCQAKVVNLLSMNTIWLQTGIERPPHSLTFLLKQVKSSLCVCLSDSPYLPLSLTC